MYRASSLDTAGQPPKAACRYPPPLLPASDCNTANISLAYHRVIELSSIKRLLRRPRSAIFSPGQILCFLASGACLYAHKARREPIADCDSSSNSSERRLQSASHVSNRQTAGWCLLHSRMFRCNYSKEPLSHISRLPTPRLPPRDTTA